MSHANGQVIFDGLLIGHFEYNGTADVVIPFVWDTHEEMLKHWREETEWSVCKCTQPAMDVLLFTDYGSEFHWPGKYCSRCHLITDGLQPYAIGDEWPIDGHPLKQSKPSESLFHGRRVQ